MNYLLRWLMLRKTLTGKQVLVRMWRTWARFIGMQNGTDTIAFSTEVPFKIKVELPWNPATHFLAFILYNRNQDFKQTSEFSCSWQHSQ